MGRERLSGVLRYCDLNSLPATTDAVKIWVIECGRLNIFEDRRGDYEVGDQMSRGMLRVSPNKVSPLYIMSYRISHILDALVASNNREDLREVGEKQTRNVVGTEDEFRFPRYSIPSNEDVRQLQNGRGQG